MRIVQAEVVKDLNHMRNREGSQVQMIILDDVMPVYRFFRERSHAEQLIQGVVWLSTLGTCRGYEEDGRGDAAEATQVYTSGEVSGTGTDPDVQHVAQHSGIKFEIAPGAKINHVIIKDATYLRGIKDAFVLCASQKFDPSCMETFGPYCVEISRPRSFLWLVTMRLGLQQPLGEAIMGKIRYLDRSYSGLQTQPGVLGFVKPAQFASQQEFRMLWTIRGKGRTLEPETVACPEIRALCRMVF